MVLRPTNAAYVVALSLCLLAVGSRASAQDGAASCAPPTPWREANARPGRPEMEFADCMRDQAYLTRNLAIPVNSVVPGIIAQCHVRVDFFEGRKIPASEADPAAEREAERQVTAAVTHYRRCAGR